MELVVMNFVMNYLCSFFDSVHSFGLFSDFYFLWAFYLDVHLRTF